MQNGEDQRVPAIEMDDQGSQEFGSRDYNTVGPLTPPKNEQYFSPDADTRTPPPRNLSTQSLAGEDIVSSRRGLSSDHVDVEFSPYTPSEATTPPDLTLQIPTSLSPPPLHVNIDSGPIDYQQSVHSAASPFRTSGNSRSRPPRVPQISLNPSRNSDRSHGRVLSNTDYSFLSALTESPSDFSAAQKRRTLSWDINDSAARRESNDRRGSPGATTNFSHKSTPANLLQPVLIDEPNRTLPPESIFTSRVNTELSNTKLGLHGVEQNRDNADAWPVDFIPRVPDPTHSAATFRTPPKIQRPPPPIVKHNPSEVKETAFRANLQTLNFASGGSDTGSFVRTSDLKKEVLPNREASEPKRYSLREVLDAVPKEGVDETELLKKLESGGSSQARPIIMPMLDDELMQDDEDEPGDSIATAKTKNYLGTVVSSTADSLDHLARKLAEVSPPHNSSTSGTSKQKNSNHLHQRRRTGTAFFTESGPQFLSPGDADVEHGVQSPISDQSSLPARRKVRSRFSHFWRKLKNDYRHFVDFVEPKREGLRKQSLRLFWVLVVPSLILATFLFYLAGNPPTGKNYPEAYARTDGASASWWLLFVGCRQILTLGLAVGLELVVIQFWTFRTRTFPNILGPSVSLIFAHARGWPFQLFAWALVDMLMLAGSGQFASHWLYWQDWIDLFNSANPGGSIVNSKVYYRVLYSALGFSLAEAMKRSFLGQFAGKRLVLRYREDLAKLMYKLIVVTEVANLSNSLEYKSPINQIVEDEDWRADDSFDYSEAATMANSDSTGREFHSSRHSEIAYLLEEWDEPELQGGDVEDPTMASILHFRKTLGVISDEYPFSRAFGNAFTRDSCINSAQELYDKLLRKSATGGPNVEFETICKIATTSQGGVDQRKAKELMRIFRPNRTGQISKIEFVKSIDSVYKMLRMLLASINNASQIDRAYESLVSTCFYIICFFVILGVLGVDVNALFLFLSGLLVSLAFMIGSASSKYVEGLLFILVRKPYDIGDRIEIANATDEIPSDGPMASVIVERVDLFTTTFRVGTTREVSTVANGTLANTKVTNLKRSERANVYMKLKFGIAITSDQTDEFRQRVMTYARDRPREWVSVVAFRCTRVEVDLGFIEYLVALQHRDSWQSLPGILQSRGDFFSFALETQKELGIYYTAPRVPIDVVSPRDSSAPILFERRGPDLEPRSLEPKKDR